MHLEDIVMASGIFLIARDFKFHVTLILTMMLRTLQKFFKPTICRSTHESDHTVDLIITRSNNDIIVCSSRAAVALSDQFLIKCNLHAPRPSSTVNLKHWISMSLKETQNLYLVRLRGKTSLSWPSATWTARWHLCLISMPLYRGKSLPKLP